MIKEEKNQRAEVKKNRKKKVDAVDFIWMYKKY